MRNKEGGKMRNPEIEKIKNENIDKFVDVCQHTNLLSKNNVDVGYFRLYLSNILDELVDEVINELNKNKK